MAMPSDRGAVATDPSGYLADGTPFYGTLGEIAYDPEQDTVQCHLCGRWLRWVGGFHLSRGHDWTIDEYRRAFGLKRSQSTMAAGSRALIREKAIAKLIDGRLGSPLGPGGLRSGGWSSLHDRRPDLVAELHPTRNGDLDPATLGVWSSEKVWWRCASCGHEWQARVRGRAANDSQCPSCGPRSSRPSPQRGQPRLRGHSLADVRPELVAELHPARNGDLDPFSVGAWSKRKLWWLCARCGCAWQTTVSCRAQGTGCPRCAVGQRIETFAAHRHSSPGD